MEDNKYQDEGRDSELDQSDMILDEGHLNSGRVANLDASEEVKEQLDSSVEQQALFYSEMIH